MVITVLDTIYEDVTSSNLDIYHASSDCSSFNSSTKVFYSHETKIENMNKVE